MTWARIDTSRALTGSSQMMSLGLQRERAGDTDALALAAGELVRVAFRVLRVEPDDLEQVRDALLRSSLVPTSWMIERLADDVADVHARVERGVRVLEDDLHVAAEYVHLTA